MHNDNHYLKNIGTLLNEKDGLTCMDASKHCPLKLVMRHIYMLEHKIKNLSVRLLEKERAAPATAEELIAEFGICD